MPWEAHLQGHPDHGLVWLDVRADDATYCLRRFLAHPRFKTLAQRMGVVGRVHDEGIHFWERNRARLQRASWPARYPAVSGVADGSPRSLRRAMVPP